VALHGHQNKPTRWVVDRYYGAFNTARTDRWVFGNRDNGAYLIKFSWIPIVRHQAVKSGASPDDPDLTEYWAKRRRKRKPLPLDQPTLSLLKAQGGCCPECGEYEYLLHADQEPQTPEEWGRWFTVVRKALRKEVLALQSNGPGDRNRAQLLHSY
jgi:RNA-directed DNA polymerase